MARWPRPQQLVRAPVADLGVDPVPGGGREDQVNRGSREHRVSVLERLPGDPHARIGGQIAPGRGGQPGTRFQAGDAEAAAGQRDRRLAGAAADLKQPGVRANPASWTS